MSTGELTVMPNDIYLTNERLRRRLKRSPTDHELAAALNMSPSSLNSLKMAKVKYNENTLTPSLLASRGAAAYRHAKPWSKKTRGNLFANDKRYDSDGGGKRRHSRRRRNKTKRSKKIN